MEITIDESVEEPVGGTNISNYSNLYWKSISPKKGWIKHEELQNAQINGFNKLEIVVTNILIPNQVELVHQFKKQKPHIPSNIVVVSDGVIVSPFSSIVQFVQLYGPATTFRFRYPVQKLLEFPADWFYSLGKEEENENVFLLLYHTGTVHALLQAPGGHPHPPSGNIPTPGPPVSRGVKIPKGRAS